MSTTFKVDSVKKEKAPLRAVSEEVAVQGRIGRVKPEAYSKTGGNPVRGGGGINAFIAAVHTAYDRHYPLVLTPDAIWMCIAQGLAQHINANAEQLRHLFVEHESKKELMVRRDDFVKGSPANPWPEVFGEFSEQIRKNIGAKLHDLLTPEFSTTGPAEKAAAQVVLMDCFKQYFDYRVMTMCGIPEITLEGTVEDWRMLRDKALSLAQFDLGWWVSALSPVLDQFVDAAAGKVDREFWSSIYKRADDSGGPYIYGWIITLFPYTCEGQRNTHLTSWNQYTFFTGLTTDQFTPGLCSTPFKWTYLDEVFPMNFYAGFMFVTQDPHSLALRPKIGWAVARDVAVQSVKDNDNPYID